jgi:hypothetical protein
MTRYLLLFRQLRSCFFGGAPSLTGGQVCLLYMLLALASTVFLGPEYLGTRGHILLSQIWDFSFRRLLRLAGSWWRYSTPPSHAFRTNLSYRLSLYRLRTDNIENTSHSYCVLLYALSSNELFTKNILSRELFIEPLPSNGNPCYNNIPRKNTFCFTKFKPMLRGYMTSAG